MDRKPVVAGQFYPGSKSSLKSEIERFLKIDAKPRKAIAAVAPHAGYVYSGAVAGKVFASVIVPKRCIVLSPNHTGMGARAAVWAHGSWQIPTGLIPVDEALAKKLLTVTPELTEDTTAHISEHSLEVELPFLLARQPDLTITPICIGRASIDVCRNIGEAIADVIKSENDYILIVASTDMNHYEDQKHTEEKDGMAIKRVETLDAEGLIRTCAQHRISMCGVLPTAIAIFAAKKIGATKATLVQHATSGDISGDYNAVVGYAGFVIE